MSALREQAEEAPVTFVCWKWRPGFEYRSKFTAEHVNVLRRMVARNYLRQHRFLCITDDAEGIDSGEVEVVELWPDHGKLLNPSGAHGPSCFRRLRLFASDAHELIGCSTGDRVVSLDLDAVVTGDLVPLYDRPETFVMWAGTADSTPYNGSMWMLRLGERPQVWDEFDPVETPKATVAAGLQGSDQAAISLILGPDEAKWTAADGVFAYKRHCLRQLGGELPHGARIVFFHGKPDPWSADVLYRRQWVMDNWW